MGDEGCRGARAYNVSENLWEKVCELFLRMLYYWMGDDIKMQKPFRFTFFKKYSILLSWLISYLFILIIPIIISGIAYSITGRIIKDKTIRSDKAAISHVQQKIDVRMEAIEKLKANIVLNEKVKKLIYAADRDSASYHYSLIQIIKDFKSYITTGDVIKDFKSYITTGDVIKDFYLYLYDSDVLLKSRGIYTTNQLFEDICKNSGISYEKWNKLLKERYNKDFIVLRGQDESGNSIDTILYLQSLPIDKSGEPAAVLIVVLDQELIHSNLKEVESINQGSVFIIDKNNQIIASVGPKQLINDFSYSFLSETDNALYHNLGRKDMAVSFATSGIYGWKYVSVTPMEILMENAQYIRELTLFSIYLCLFIGGIFIYIFSKRNYNPVKEIVHILSNKVGVKYDKEYNEFHFINRIVSDTIDENKKISEILNKQRGFLKSNYLANIMKGKAYPRLPAEDALDCFEISFLSNEFAVILFYIEDFCKLFENNGEIGNEKKVELVKNILCNTSEELIGAKNICYTVEIDEMLACLVNFRSTEYHENKEDMERALEEIQKKVLSEYYITTTISVSDIHHSREGITEAYMEAIEAMQYKMVTGTGKIIFYNCIKKTQMYYEYTLAKEYQLINVIKAGDFNKGGSIIGTIFEKSFQNGHFSINIARCLSYDIVGTVMKAIESTDSDTGKEFLDGLNPIQCLIDCKTIEEMKIRLTGIIEEVCSFMGKNKKGCNRKLIDNIIVYINSNYSNYNISISFIADRFDSNPAYLSRLFKEQTGQNLLDYINIVRIEKAKQFMKDSDQRIYKVAEKVGYNDSNTFIKTFKKYEGITPGQYKCICSSNYITS